MRTIIAGSRTLNDIKQLGDALILAPFRVSTVICGCAKGVDELGKRFALAAGLPIEYFPADWDTHGKRAGYLRNYAMADNAEALLAVWDGQSKGTQHMIDIAEAKGLQVFVYVLDTWLDAWSAEC